jgi:hypothetical protein
LCMQCKPMKQLWWIHTQTIILAAITIALFPTSTNINSSDPNSEKGR